MCVHVILLLASCTPPSALKKHPPYRFIFAPHDVALTLGARMHVEGELSPSFIFILYDFLLHAIGD